MWHCLTSSQGRPTGGGTVPRAGMVLVFPFIEGFWFCARTSVPLQARPAGGGFAGGLPASSIRICGSPFFECGVVRHCLRADQREAGQCRALEWFWFSFHRKDFLVLLLCLGPLPRSRADQREAGRPKLCHLHWHCGHAIRRSGKLANNLSLAACMASAACRSVCRRAQFSNCCSVTPSFR